MSRPSRREARRAARRLMKQRRAEVKARLAAARAPADRARRRRNLRRRLVLLAILLLIYLLLRSCDCDDPPGAGPIADMGPDAAAMADDMGPDAARSRPRKKAAKPRPIEASIRGTGRPTFENPTPAPPDWLVALRIQVSARGPRLARCFEGADRPGALRWSARVDIPRGVVSDHDFEPVLGGADLSKDLRRCLVGVLADPRYHLPPAPEAGQPRISIVVEF